MQHLLETAILDPDNSQALTVISAGEGRREALVGSDQHHRATSRVYEGWVAPHRTDSTNLLVRVEGERLVEPLLQVMH